MINNDPIKVSLLQLCEQIQSFHPDPYKPDKRHKSVMNVLFKKMINTVLEYDFNIPSIFIVNHVQATYNFSFSDANSFAQARFISFLVNTVSELYFILENFVNYLIEDEKYVINKEESNIRNKINLLMNDANIKDQNRFRDIVTVFTKLRHSAHTLGVYHGENKKYVFGNIIFDFKKDKGSPLSTTSFVYLQQQLILLIELLVTSDKYSKYYN